MFITYLHSKQHNVYLRYVRVIQNGWFVTHRYACVVSITDSTYIVNDIRNKSYINCGNETGKP